MNSRRSYLLVSTLLVLSACKSGGNNSQSSEAPSTTAVAQANPVDPATAGTIEGVIKFTGAKPKSQKISMSADAYCKTAHATDVMAEDVVVNANNTLQNVYVYVKSGLTMKFPAPTTPAVLDQKGCMYSPHILVAQVGQPIRVRNSDGVLHNVNAQPKKNQGFNFGQPVQGMEADRTFTTPEVMVPVKCDVHPWMRSYIGVQDHPYASVSDNTGAFSLKNLPPGEYEIEAWHEKYGTSVQKVKVGANETKKIEFSFKGA